MKSLLLILILSFALSCSNRKSPEFAPISFSEEESRENLKKVDKSTLENWGLRDYALNYLDYEYYKDLDGDFKPLVIRVSGDDYFALVLYTFDEQGKIISDYEISGGSCGGPTELGDKIELCPSRTSTMIGPTTFIVKSVQKFLKDYDDEKPTKGDSTQWKIEINQFGKIVEIK